MLGLSLKPSSLVFYFGYLSAFVQLIYGQTGNSNYIILINEKKSKYCGKKLQKEIQ